MIFEENFGYKTTECTIVSHNLYVHKQHFFRFFINSDNKLYSKNVISKLHLNNKFVIIWSHHDIFHSC